MKLRKLLLGALALFTLSCTKDGRTIIIGKDRPKLSKNLVIDKDNIVVDGRGDTLNSITVRSSNVVIRNVVLKKEATDMTSGLSVIADGVHLRNIRLDNITSMGYGFAGIYAYASPTGGITKLVISNSKASDNGYAGIVITSEWPNMNIDNALIRNCQAFDNRGNKGEKPHTGHGIVMGGVTNSRIDSCRAWNNGYMFGDGNIGIWTYESVNVIIENSVSYGNKTKTQADGGGFDLDGGVSNSTIRNCISYDNDGAGYLLYEWGSPNVCQNNTFRNNTSTHDGKTSKYYSGFTLGGVQPIYNTLLENNTVIPLPGKEAVTYFNKHFLVGLTLIGNNF